MGLCFVRRQRGLVRNPESAGRGCAVWFRQNGFAAKGAEHQGLGPPWVLCPPVGLYASIRLILDDSYRVLVGAQLVRGMVQSFTADTGNGMLANPGAATKTGRVPRVRLVSRPGMDILVRSVSCNEPTTSRLELSNEALAATMSLVMALVLNACCLGHGTVAPTVYDK